MADGGIELKEITYGQLNNLQENDNNASGDRRRTDPVAALRIATEQAFARDTLRGRAEFYGIVVGRRVLTTAIYDYRPTVLNSFATITPEAAEEGDEAEVQDVDINQFLYKVYIPELQPLCPPTSFADPIIFNYPDVGVDLPEGGHADIGLGAFVTVRYEDPGNLFGPKIVKASDDALAIKNLTIDAINGQIKFKQGIPSVIGPGTGLMPEDEIDPALHHDRVIPGSSNSVFKDLPATRNLLDAIQQAATAKGKYVRVSSGYRNAYNQARVMLNNHNSKKPKGQWLLDIYGTTNGKEARAIFDSTLYDREATIRRAAQLSWIANAAHSRGAFDISWVIASSRDKLPDAPSKPPPAALTELMLDVMRLTTVKVLVEGDHYHLDPGVSVSSVKYAKTVGGTLKQQISAQGFWNGGTLAEIDAAEGSITPVGPAPTSSTLPEDPPPEDDWLS
jgi:hypothetical protein